MPSEAKTSILLNGSPVSPGITVARVVVHDSSFLPTAPTVVPASQVERQVRLLEQALDKARTEIDELQHRLRSSLDAAHAAIFDSHLLFVQDPALKEKVTERIRTRRESAQFALRVVIQELADQFMQMQDAYISSRSSDVFDIGNRIGKHLNPARPGAGPSDRPYSFSGDVIIFARDLSPSDTAQMDHTHVKALAMEMGGPTSHTAILAKALEIPAVVGVGPFLHYVNHQTMAIVDGYEGTIIINPTPAEMKRARSRRRRSLAQERSLEKLRHLPAETLDGYRIDISANLELPNEIGHVLAHGASGIGLFRTEFIYLNRTAIPTEEQQFEVYKKVLQSVPGRVIFRTLDVGGDKFFTEVSAREELNPFLGLRAIRFCLEHPEIFKPQIRALLRASAFGQAKVMFPMVSSLSEVFAAKEMVRLAKGELTSEGLAYDPNIEIGIMIEIPSAALIADQLAGHVDFFSIGTNDLIQYTLAIDRGNERVASLYDPYHPAILRLIRRVIDAAHRTGIWAGVCGEMASNPMTALLLLGMGIDELSMGPLAIPRIKNIIRNISLGEARKVAGEVHALGSSIEIRQHIEESFRRFEKMRIKEPAAAAVL